MLKRLFDGYKCPVTQTISFQSKQLNTQCDFDSYNYEYLPTNKIFELINRELDLYNGVDKPISIRVISNSSLFIQIELTGQSEKINEFVDKLSCNSDMLKYVIW